MAVFVMGHPTESFESLQGLSSTPNDMKRRRKGNVRSKRERQCMSMQPMNLLQNLTLS